MNKRILSPLSSLSQPDTHIQKASKDGVCVTLNDLVALEAKASGFSFLPKQPVHSVLSGRHASRLRGRGMEFEDIRPYLMGDDVRTMDWKVMARTRKPHVRVYSEERDRPVYCVVDQRPALFFGSQVCFKSVVAAKAAALAIWRAFASGDRVGGCVLGSDDITEFKPRRCKTALLQMLHTITEKNQYLLQKPTMTVDQRMRLNQGLRRAARNNHHDCLVCVISDGEGLDASSEKLLSEMAAKNDVLWVSISDPLESQLPQYGRFVAGDGVNQAQINLNNRQLRQDFETDAQQDREQWRVFFRKAHIPYLHLTTQTKVEEQIRSQLGYIPRSRFIK